MQSSKHERKVGETPFERAIVTRFVHSGLIADESESCLYPASGWRYRASRNKRDGAMLTPTHDARVRALYAEVCRENGWSYPSSIFRFSYLDADEMETLARFGFENKTIWLHPEAFNWPNPELIKGLINHEMAHWLLGPKEGHGKAFSELERSWPGYADYRIEVVAFANHLRARDAEYEVTCLTCGDSYNRKIKPKSNAACRKCCDEHNEGVWSPRYKLHIGVVVSAELLGPSDVRVDG